MAPREEALVELSVVESIDLHPLSVWIHQVQYQSAGRKDRDAEMGAREGGAVDRLQTSNRMKREFQHGCISERKVALPFFGNLSHRSGK